MSYAPVFVATLADSLAGLAGVFLLLYRRPRVLSGLVAFSAGVMLTGALVHMFPEAIEGGAPPWVAVLGFLMFFAMESFLNWHHCHDGNCSAHPVGYLTAAGDGIHNFVDGLIIAAAFSAGGELGVLATAMILLHEVPQELGNFAVLLHAGMDRSRALALTFLSQATCVLGGLAGWLFLPAGAVPSLLAIAAGGFLYISASDLVPELHRKDSDVSLFVAGVLLMLFLHFHGA